MRFGDGNIAWVNTMKYLISSKCLKIGMCRFLRKFYASVNAIIAHSIMAHSKFVNEDVKLRLFESFSLPLLTLA